MSISKIRGLARSDHSNKGLAKWSCVARQQNAQKARFTAWKSVRLDKNQITLDRPKR
ncbi:hypothetical protein ACLB1R_31870 [Escherichia coli]